MLADLRLMLSNRSMLFSLSVGFAVSLLIGFAFTSYQSPVSVFRYGDAYEYLFAAKGINEANSILQAGVRTYGYIFVLWLFTKPFQWFQAEVHWISFATAIIQIVFLSLIACSLASTVSKKDAGIQKIIVLGAILNPFLLALVPLMLTEVPSVVLMALVYLARCRIANSDSRALVVGLLSGFAVELRPANLWLLGAAGVVVFLDALTAESKGLDSRGLNSKGLDTKGLARPLFIFVAGAIVPMVPQIIYNGIKFGKFTALPAGGLAGNQFEWGRDWLRAGFIFRLPDQNYAIISENPFKISGLLPFSWFSLDGPAYGVLKVISFFINDRLFVYQMEPNAFASKAVILLSSFSVYFGISGLMKSGKHLGAYHIVPIVIAIVFCTVLHLPTALENRFSIQVFAILFPFALYRLVYFEKSVVFLGGFLVFFGTCAAFSGIFLSLSPGYRLLAPQGVFYGR